MITDEKKIAFILSLFHDAEIDNITLKNNELKIYVEENREIVEGTYNNHKIVFTGVSNYYLETYDDGKIDNIELIIILVYEILHAQIENEGFSITVTTDDCKIQSWVGKNFINFEGFYVLDASDNVSDLSKFCMS